MATDPQESTEPVDPDASPFEPRSQESPRGVDPDASPFELQPIEGLPLTDRERAELRRVLADFDRKRAGSAAD